MSDKFRVLRGVTGGYRIEDPSKEVGDLLRTVGTFADGKVGATHHAFALMELRRIKRLAEVLKSRLEGPCGCGLPGCYECNAREIANEMLLEPPEADDEA